MKNRFKSVMTQCHGKNDRSILCISNSKKQQRTRIKKCAIKNNNNNKTILTNFKIINQYKVKFSPSRPSINIKQTTTVKLAYTLTRMRSKINLNVCNLQIYTNLKQMHFQKKHTKISVSSDATEKEQNSGTRCPQVSERPQYAIIP